MDVRRSQDLDVEGIGNRRHVDIRSLKEVAPALKCSTCKQPMTQTGNRQRSVIWYCSRCDVFRETTVAGSELRSFKKEATQIINLDGDQ